MKKLIITLFVVVISEYCYSQIVDTIFFKNTFFLSESKISDSVKNACKFECVDILQVDSLESSYFNFENKLYKTSYLEELTKKLKGGQKIKLIVDKDKISDYIIQNSLQPIVIDSLLQRPKKVDFILDYL